VPETLPVPFLLLGFTTTAHSKPLSCTPVFRNKIKKTNDHGASPIGSIGIM